MKLLLYAALLSVWSAGSAGFAQSSVGSLTIKLTDPYARPLEGAIVTVRNHATGGTVQSSTAQGGIYQLVGLEPGSYTVIVASERLGQASLDDVQVLSGHEVRVQIALQLALVAHEETAPEDTVPGEIAPEVAAFAPAPASIHGGVSVVRVAFQMAQSALRASQLLDPASEFVRADSSAAPLGTDLTVAQLEALPLTGHNWQSLLEDARSESTEAETETAFAHDMRGVVFDGVDTRLAFGPRSARGPGSSLVGPAASETAIREVEAARGTAGETADRRGGQLLSIAPERGGERFHGHASLFDRQNVLGAQNPLTQWVQESAPATSTTVPVFTPESYTPGDRELAWNTAAGGPLFRHRLFWFMTIDGFDRDVPAVSTVKHPNDFFAQPSNDQMQVLSARLGLSGTNPVVEGLGAYSSMLQTLDGLLGPAARTSKQATGFARGDWMVSPRQRFTLEGASAIGRAFGGGMTSASESYGTHSFGSRRVDDQWLLARWQATLTPHLLAVTQASAGRQFVAIPPPQPSVFERSLDVNAWGRLPQITVDSRYGFTIGSPVRFGPGGDPDEHFYEAQEQLGWMRGARLVKAGFSLRHSSDGTGFLRNQAGTYHYASVENFASDTLAFAAFGLSGQLNPMDQHNCDQTGRVWRDTTGTLHGLGYLPCYSWYSQTMGPSNWWLSTNDSAGFVSLQGQPGKNLTASLALRWEQEESPAPIALVDNPDLPLTEKTPQLGSQWGPRIGLAWGKREGRLPVLRIGYGMYFGRTPNALFEQALTQTGSSKGDLNFFMRPTDNLNAGGAPPFPYVLAGEPASVVKPSAVEFASGFHNGETHQATASLEETLPGRVHVDAGAVASLGRRLPISEDANIDPAVNPQTITYAVVDGNGSGPIKTPQITVPFFASWPSATSPSGFAGRLNPNYQQVVDISSRANSTYEAAFLRVTRTSHDGLTLRARYAFAHMADWNPIESATVTGPSVFDPTDFRQEYGTSSLDVRHTASATVLWEPRWRFHHEGAFLVNGWMLSGVGNFRSGLPYTMRTDGSLAKEFTVSEAAIVALGPGMNGYGDADRVYGVGRNTYRYPGTWKADLRLGKRFDVGEMRQIEVLAESFNLFNHQNVTELETVGYSIESGSLSGGFPTLNFLTGLKTGQTEFGQPLNSNATDFYRPRQIQFGMRFKF